MLRQCTFRSPHMTETVDLEPLRALPNLQHLTLERGDYANVQAAAIQLTTLELICCEAHCAQQCQCVTLLEVLNMEYAALHGLHSDGILACRQLNAFKCIYSSVVASGPEQSFECCRTSKHIPTGLTALTRLTQLEVGHGAEVDVGVDLDWVTQVQSLQVLRVNVVCNSLWLTNILSCMSNIRSLTIDGSARHELPSCSVMSMLDWSMLVSLEELHLHGALRVVEEHRLSKLASLALLHTVDFAEGTKRGVDEVRQLVELAHKLGRDRPDVVMSITDL